MSADKPKTTVKGAKIVQLTPEHGLSSNVPQKAKKPYPRDEKFEFVTPARLKRSHTFTDLVNTRILFNGDQYSHLQIRGYMNGLTWCEYLRNLVTADMEKHPHSTVKVS